MADEALEFVYLPLAHDWHTPQLVAPTTELQEPKSQLSHELIPVFAANLPAGQSGHTDAPALENLPSAQLTHCDSLTIPAVLENFPAGQFVQLDPY